MLEALLGRINWGQFICPRIRFIDIKVLFIQEAFSLQCRYILGKVASECIWSRERHLEFKLGRGLGRDENAKKMLKSLNDRQSDIFLKFKELKEYILFKLWYVD